MTSRKFRKVKLANDQVVISDKEIFTYLFNPDRLQRMSNSPQHLLDGTLEDIRGAQIEWIDENSTLTEAALSMVRSPGKFLLSGNGIVTPWDLIIKPWRLGSLRISRPIEVDR